MRKKLEDNAEKNKLGNNPPLLVKLAPDLSDEQISEIAKVLIDVKIDGVILTKLDGDTRGGAALSLRHVTGKPVKFAGIGEQMDKLGIDLKKSKSNSADKAFTSEDISKKLLFI